MANLKEAANNLPQIYTVSKDKIANRTARI